MTVHHPIERNRHICIYSKNFFIRGVVRGIDFENLSQRDYLQRGVKTGMNYPHICLTTCLRVMKMPLQPTIVAEIKDFLSILPPAWGDTSSQQLKQLKDARLALACQSKSRKDKSLCFHPLEHFLYHIQSIRCHLSTFSNVLDSSTSEYLQMA